MGTNHVTTEVFNSPAEAPKYERPEFNYASLEKAIIVKNGTVKGNSTIDLVFIDEKGQKHVAMITAKLIQLIGEMAK